MAAENAGKAVLSLFDVTPKTHEPAQQIAALLREGDLPANIHGIMLQILPDLLDLGKREHFLTDYGDEANYTLPWDLFTKESAEEAFEAAQRSLETAKKLVAAVKAEWKQE